MTPNHPPGRRAWRTEEQWQHLRARIDAAGADALPPETSRFRWTTWAAAAAILALAGSATFLVSRSGGATRSRVVTTPAGERTIIRLDDSTVITLGPASTIRYTIGASTRSVEVEEGMAAFRVVHDSTRPFVVRARDAIATDVGTEFVVRAYAGDSSVSVAVTKGVVALTTRVTDATPGAPLMLRAGDVGRVANGAAVAAPTVQHATAAAYAAWVNGALTFDNQPLSAVAAELGRWFNADIRIESPALANRRVTAMYNDPKLSNVLEALASTMAFDYARTGRSIILRPRTP